MADFSVMQTSSHRVWILLLLLVAVLFSASATSAEPLATGELLIRGMRLEVSPGFQEIDPGRPTVVHTSLGDLSIGQVPAGLRVEGELSGPGLDDALHLSTVPGEPFRLPGLNREGSYVLSGIRLTDEGRILLEAEPSSVEILVHRIVIASITSRPLDPDEMADYGIVITDDSYSAWHYTVGFEVEGERVDIPFDILRGPDGVSPIRPPSPYYLPVPEIEGSLPTINFQNLSGVSGVQGDLADDPAGGVTGGTPAIPGFLIFPTDIAFLHQFFSVIMVVQNGALEGSGLELRDLTAVLELADDGIRQAATEPPTIPGEPVTIMDPGPDGSIGTSDDLTFIIAGASGEATWLVEGIEEGQHRVTARLTGELHGLASGEPELIAGEIPGVVLVRDPRFSMTFFHPWTVRAGEPYELKVVIANTSTTPVYDLGLTLPGTALTGARLVDDEYGNPQDEHRHVPELPPGESAMVAWDLLALTTGAVVASGFNTSNAIDASFRFEMGVGELGIPLSPESLVLPPIVDLFPPPLNTTALELLGLAYSLATAPNGAEVDLPPVGETAVMARAVEMATCARRVAYGEDLNRALMSLGLKWMGAERWSDGFDALYRASTRGHDMETHLAAAIAARIDDSDEDTAFADLEEVAITGRPTVLVYAKDAGYEGVARLAIIGETSNTAAVAQSADVGIHKRDLPGAAILEVEGDTWSGEVGVISIPVDDDGRWLESGYEIQLHGSDSGTVALEVVLVMPDGATRRFQPSSVVPAASGSLVLLTIEDEADEAQLWIDSNGDTLADDSETIAVDNQLPPEPRLVSARFDSDLNPPEQGPYDDLILLFSQSVDKTALAAVDPNQWVISSHLELTADDGELVVSDRARHGERFATQSDPAFIVLSCDLPLNPHAELALSTAGQDIPFLSTRTLTLTDEVIEVTAHAMDSGMVRGLVIGADGLPLPGARVDLLEKAVYGSAWVDNASDHVVADANGAFRFDAVRYRHGSVPGRYAAFTIRAVDPITGYEARAGASLAGDAVVRDLSVFMVGRGDVIGTVTREDGAALSEALVHGRSVANPEEYAVAEPDTNGSYRLTGLPVGAVQVLAVDGSDYTYGAAMVPGPGQEGRLDLVLPISSQAVAQVEGNVTDGETAEPLSGVQVYLLPPGSQAATHLATTGTSGEFSMADVPPGLVTFKVWDPARNSWIATHNSELLGDAVNQVAIVTTTTSTGSVSGTVYQLDTGSRTPVAGAYVMARSHNRWTITDSQGEYRLDDLTLGAVVLDAIDPATGLSTVRTVSLTADGQELLVDFDLETGTGSGQILVTVVDRQGLPVAGATVGLEHFGGGNPLHTASDGTVLIEGVAKGNYTLVTRYGGGLGRGSATVAFDGHLAEAQVVVGGTVSLTVVTTADTTGGGTIPILSAIGYRRPGVNDEGYITMLPEEGETSCEVGDDLICSVEGVPEGVGPLQVFARNPFYGMASLSEELDPEDDGKELEINFSAPGAVSGTVLTESGDQLVPVAGALVELWVREAGSQALSPQGLISTESDGSFSFDLIPPGGFSLRVYHETLHLLGRLDGVIQSAQVLPDLELLVSGTASVAGEVAVCFGGGGSGETVSLTARQADYPEPFISVLDTVPELQSNDLVLTLDGEGRASFTVSGLALGGWSLHFTSASHGSAWIGALLDVAGEVRSIADPICLHPTGSVSGRITYPESGEGAPSVQVQLFRMGHTVPELLTAETTDDEGGFIFPDLPVGSHYQVRALEAASNRGGESSWLELCDASHPDFGTGCFLNPFVEVGLAGLGTVEGSVLDQDGQGVSNAYIRLQTSVVVNQDGQVVRVGREYLAFSGSGGSYSFPGVPTGAVQLTAYDPMSPLFVTHGQEIDSAIEPTTTIDLRFPGTAALSVSVLDPAGEPLDGEQPVVAFRQSARHHYSEPSGGGTTVWHLGSGDPVTFDGVVASGYDTAACLGDCGEYTVLDILGQAFAEALGARLAGTMADPPEDQAVELQLVGRAGARVQVTQNGEPAEGAEVRLSGRGYYGSYSVVTQTATEGWTTAITNLGVGDYTVSATQSDGVGNILRGVGSFAVDQADHGSTLDVVVALEAAGAADGVVLDAQGSPAAGALVTMGFDDGGVWRIFQAVTGGDGSFVFSALPSATGYEVEVYAAQGAGRHTVHGVTVGSDVNHLGQLVLDEADPMVAAIEPSNGAQSVDQSTAIVIDFSEPMRHQSLIESRIRLREEGTGAVVWCSLSVSDVADPDGDFTEVTLDPTALASDTSYLVDVLRGVEDAAGRTVAYDLHYTFRTRDATPPDVIAVDPVHDATGVSPVGPDVEPVLTFSEPVDPDTVDDTTVRLLDALGADVATQLVVERAGFDVRVRPTTGLALDAFYTIEVSGIADTSGNTMAAPYLSTFRVRDAEPPIATLLPPDGASVDVDSWRAVEGSQLVLRASVLSNDAVGTVVFAVDGLDVGTGAFDPAHGSYALGFTAPVAVAQIMLSVRAVDVSGNLSNTASHLLEVVDDAPPSGTMDLDPSVEILPNHLLGVTVTAADDYGLRWVHLTLSGAIVTTESIQVSATTAVAGTSFRVPVDAVAGGQVVVACEVEDSLGQSTPLPPQTVTVAADVTAPVVSTVEPQPGETFTSDETVTFSFDLADDVTVATVTLDVDNEAVPLTISGVAPPGTSWTASASGWWTATEVTTPQTVSWTLTATDHAGNVQIETEEITIQPQVNPDAPLVSFLCPVDGGGCAPDVAQTVSFTLSDPNPGDLIETYTALVNDMPLAGYENNPVNAATFSGTISWTPPASAVPGEIFVLTIEAFDGVHVGTASITLKVPAGLILSGDQDIDWGLNGLDVVLAEGTFSATTALDLASLTLLQEATLTTGSQQPLGLTVAGAVSVSCEAAIDVSERGYPADTTYPDEAWSMSLDGGNHMGNGGDYGGDGSSGSTFGSVTAPLEAGGGSAGGSYGRAGGGVVRITAGSLSLDGAIRANGESRDEAGGAGGSVWITVAGEISGSGVVEANGGSHLKNRTGGGGGAIAMTYAESSGTVMDNLGSRGGTTLASGAFDGGAGTVYLYQSGVSVHGNLEVDNAGTSGQATELPALGWGASGPGSGEATLETGFADIQPYFVGHWVEVYEGDSDTLRGTWRITAINGGTITLDVEGDPDGVAENDVWQGVYRFDSLTVGGGAQLISDDPIRTPVAIFGANATEATLLTPVSVSGSVEIAGDVTARSIEAHDMVIEDGAILSHPAIVNPLIPESLEIVVIGGLEIMPAAVIDVTGRGYPMFETYPGEPEPLGGSGGSHLGIAGYLSSAGATYGSVTRPQEAGSGSKQDKYWGAPGGGAVRIETGSLQVDGAIRANGESSWLPGGAGGSVWITASGEISGDGVIEAEGGESTNSTRAGGGGGAIAVDFGTAAGTVFGNLSARGGECGSYPDRSGGAGTVYTFETGVSILGDLLVDNDGLLLELTELPPLGTGTAVTGTFSAELVTDSGPIQPYLVGHWVEVYVDAEMTQLRGAWQIASIAADRLTVTLAENAEFGTATVYMGDTWQGVYRFDEVIVQNGAELESLDPIRAPGWAPKRGAANVEGHRSAR